MNIGSSVKSIKSNNTNGGNTSSLRASSSNGGMLGGDKSPIRSRRVENYDDVIGRLMQLSVSNVGNARK